MESDLKSIYDTKTVELILEKLYGIKVISTNTEINSRVMEIVSLLKNTAVEEDVSVPCMIQETMRDMKRTNPELHFTLYKLHRKLSEGKISEEEAYKLYKNYCG